MHQDQKVFKGIVDEFLSNISKQTLILRSRYDSRKTTFMQRFIQQQNPERVLFYNLPPNLGKRHHDEL